MCERIACEADMAAMHIIHWVSDGALRRPAAGWWLGERGIMHVVL